MLSILFIYQSPLRFHYSAGHSSKPFICFRKQQSLLCYFHALPCDLFYGIIRRFARRMLPKLADV
jgi:hypothetical protein